MLAHYLTNKTGLQPVSRPVEQILGFFPKGFNAKNGAKMCSKNVLKVTALKVKNNICMKLAKMKF